MTRTERSAALLLSVAAIGLMVTASWLEPSPTGVGTHRQLGLPPCTWLLVTGQPCPSCGMTTSWSLWMQGQIVAAWRANAAGCVLAATATVVGPWLLVSGIIGAWLLCTPRAWWWVAGLAGLYLVALADWIFKLVG
jgi:hypothetical protein